VGAVDGARLHELGLLGHLAQTHLMKMPREDDRTAATVRAGDAHREGGG
jgi:hypothetical protein